MRKPKTVEIVVRVRVPKHWSAAHARREVSAYWYGKIYANGPKTRENAGFGEDVVLHPKWGRAHVVKPEPPPVPPPPVSQRPGVAAFVAGYDVSRRHEGWRIILPNGDILRNVTADGEREAWIKADEHLKEQAL